MHVLDDDAERCIGSRRAPKRLTPRPLTQVRGWFQADTHHSRVIQHLDFHPLILLKTVDAQFKLSQTKISGSMEAAIKLEISV